MNGDASCLDGARGSETVTLIDSEIERESSLLGNLGLSDLFTRLSYKQSLTKDRLGINLSKPYSDTLKAAIIESK